MRWDDRNYSSLRSKPTAAWSRRPEKPCTRSERWLALVGASGVYSPSERCPCAAVQDEELVEVLCGSALKRLWWPFGALNSNYLKIARREREQGAQGKRCSNRVMRR